MTFEANNINCQNCANTIISELKEDFGEIKVDLSVSPRRVSVELDEDKEQWQNTVNEQDLNWVQLSDLQGWNSKAARLFEVSSIPYTLVVAQDGTIIASGLRGESLNAFIKSRITPQTE